MPSSEDTAIGFTNALDAMVEALLATGWIGVGCANSVGALEVVDADLLPTAPYAPLTLIPPILLLLLQSAALTLSWLRPSVVFFIDSPVDFLVLRVFSSVRSNVCKYVAHLEDDEAEAYWAEVEGKTFYC
jgi:hypothetical protein